jgi:GINS complex subunit 2
MDEGGLGAAYNEFCAEDTVITIVPSINHPTLRFISGTFGPLQSGLPCLVPLWLAINLRKRGKCVIKIPHWLTVANLEQFSKLEREEPNLSNLPFHYVEIAHLLLTHAVGDIPEPERVAALVQDLEDTRMDRLRHGINSLVAQVQSDVSVVSTLVTNVAAMEILNTKAFLLNSLESFIWLRPPNGDNA